MKIGTRIYYHGTIAVPAGKLDGVEVRHIHHPAGTTLYSSSPRTFLFGQQGKKIIYDEPTIWHELSEDAHGVWMTDLPIEQRQHDEIIARAHGRVLVGGLGLGYAVVALSARKKVTEIVVVEQNPAIITLVWEATVKRTRPSVKVSVVQADLFAYLKARQAAKQGRPEFNWGFFDIWQGDGEATFHEVVVPLRALADGVVRTLTCWNEDVMRGQLYMGLETRVALLTMPDEQRLTYERMIPTFDQLTTPTGSKYTDWAIPFWRWFKDHAYPEGVYDADLVKLMLRYYVQAYGRPEMMKDLPGFHRYQSEIVAGVSL